MSHQRAGTTTSAAVLNFLLCGVFALAAAGAILLGAATSSIEGESRVFEDLTDSFGALLVVIGLVIAAAVAWGVVLGVKILQRRPWARRAGIVTYSVFTLIGLLNAAAGLQQEDGAAGPGVSLAVITAIVLGLLLAGPTRRDFATAAEPPDQIGPYARVLPPGVRWDPPPDTAAPPPPGPPPG